jgi:hypothetical protein
MCACDYASQHREESNEQLTEDFMVVGDRLRELREGKELSQGDIQDRNG